MPPVMGAAAFIMAEFTDSSYMQIVVLSLVPALLFYLSLAIYGHLTVLKMGIHVTEEDVNEVGFTGTLSTAPVFIVPLAVITVILAIGYTASMAIFWGICVLLAISLLVKKVVCP